MAGWSVTVIGHAAAVTDRAEIGRLEQLPLTSWAPGNRDHFIGISSSIVNGRRIEAGFDAIMAGAAGYVLKQIRGTDLVGAVRTVAAGESMLDARAAGQVMARLRDSSRKRDPLAGLTPQERRILELIGEGLTNRQIGERMFLAEKTVKNYVSALFAKLGMERRTQAAAYAVRVLGEQDGAGRGGSPAD